MRKGWCCFENNIINDIKKSKLILSSEDKEKKLRFTLLTNTNVKPIRH